MSINKMVNDCHKNSKGKGFWDDTFLIPEKMAKSDIFSGQEISMVMSAFKSRFLMLIVSELGEAIESDRKGKFADMESYEQAMKIKEFSKDKVFEKYIKDTFQDEIADVFIRLFDFCGGFNIDIEKFIDLKRKYNSNRPKLHGKKY
jgi:NTP pyrophosphatase (non-canonical NTP hydrolase)